MDKLDKNNKIKDSFENQLPDELPLDLVWENISDKLNAALTEETEKVKQSFEHGFKKEPLPVFLWSDIAEKLDTEPSSEGYKIKESFEDFYKNELPNDIWDSLENQLEIETVWNRVHQNLNQNTKKHYWREKAMQLGIAVLALFWLRGCDVGEQFGKAFSAENTPSNIVSNEAVDKSFLKNNANTSPILQNKENSRNDLKDQNSGFNGSLEIKKELLKDDFKTKKDDFGASENFLNDASHSKKDKNDSSIKQKTPQNKLVPNKGHQKDRGVIGKGKINSEGFNKDGKANKKKTANDLIVSDDYVSTSLDHSLPNDLPIVQNEKVQNEKITLSKLFSDNPLATLTGGFILEPKQNFNIETDIMFYIKNKSKKFQPHFEIGLVGRLGTSILLCGTTHEALESNSMVKTEMRLAGSAGLTFHAFLTKNDAIVVGAYPFSSHQQYFGGYSRDGRFYNKEIKLAYFDFSVGYQRTLLNYNKRKKIPSALYVRVEYNLGYLHHSEEFVDKKQLKSFNSYKQLNHSLGLSLGNTHRIGRFAIDYGIYANVGLNSVSDTRKSMPVLEAPQLMNMGGYLGVRYRF